MNIKYLLLLILTFSIGTITLHSDTALAHEGRELAGLSVELGFEVEPPIEGLPNGIIIIARKEGAAAEHEDDDMAMDAAASIDVEAHGGLFGSGTIEPGGTFEFVLTTELNDLVIPFHNHLNHDAKGEIHVMPSAPAADTFTIEIGHDGFFEPAMIMVQPETKLLFNNVDEVTQTVVSGSPDGGAVDESNLVPAEGLEQTLKVEIIHTETGESRVLRLQPVFGSPGRYLASLIPTATGQYSVRLFGTVGEEEVDTTFVSGPGTFDDVVPATSLQFPNEIPSARELEAVARGAQVSVNEALDAADDANSSASTALMIGIIGIIVGALGLAVGGFAVITTRKSAQ
ncbi:MAG: hypothetical protein HQ478_05320 [Chloroflexi bacterium]|nr:hypothetical protein [Chloroflexota bacterium]